MYIDWPLLEKIGSFLGSLVVLAYGISVVKKLAKRISFNIRKGNLKLAMKQFFTAYIMFVTSVVLPVAATAYLVYSLRPDLFQATNNTNNTQIAPVPVPSPPPKGQPHPPRQRQSHSPADQTRTQQPIPVPSPLPIAQPTPVPAVQAQQCICKPELGVTELGAAGKSPNI